VLRWFLDGTRMRYAYLHEGIDVLATRSPSLHGVPLAAKPPTT
jgi:hypothetical protein